MKPRTHSTLFLHTIFAMLAAIAALVSPASATSCADKPFRALFDEADAVFLAYTVKVGFPKEGEGDRSAFQTVITTAQLIRTWKGKVPKEVDISVNYLQGYTGQPFQRKQIYLVFANHQDNSFTTNRCDVVGPIPQNYYYLFKLLGTVGEGERIGNNRLDREREYDNQQQRPAGVRSGSNYLE